MQRTSAAHIHMVVWVSKARHGSVDGGTLSYVGFFLLSGFRTSAGKKHVSSYRLKDVQTDVSFQ